ncbi:MAG: AraC family transcriptional regulator [bacterium]|nr:AraC family transcriptional regulator [bacterium]
MLNNKLIHTASNNVVDFVLETLHDETMTLDYSLPSRMYMVIFLEEGEGLIKYGGNAFNFAGPSVFFFAAYQPFQIMGRTKLLGKLIHFAQDFFCIDHHHLEVGCQGLLFNNAYDITYIKLRNSIGIELNDLVQKIENEMALSENADADLIATYLKLILKISVKEKKLQQETSVASFTAAEKPIHNKLRQLIEANFRTGKSSSDYAELLNISQKVLANQTKLFFGKTVTQLVQERVVFEAKSLLFKTAKSIKEISNELGFDDSSYFSRLFKNVTSVSPEKYRDTIYNTP